MVPSFFASLFAADETHFQKKKGIFFFFIIVIILFFLFREKIDSVFVRLQLQVSPYENE